MQELQICFAGTPAFAARHLQAILNSSHQVVAVFTQPDRPSGRGKVLSPGPVKQLALDNSVLVLQPKSLKSLEQQEILVGLGADLLVVVAYGLILPEPILQIPKLGCINVHASLLPRWRGAAPIERAILAGDKETGITIMQMDEGLDTGDMIHKTTVPIEANDGRPQLEEKLAKAGVEGLLHVLDNFSRLAPMAEKQDDTCSSYAHKVEKSEALIDWHEAAEIVNRQVRAGLGRSPAYSFLGGDRVRILQAIPECSAPSLAAGTIIRASKSALSVACQDSILQITSLQFPGKRPTPIADALNSRRDLLKPGVRFSSGAPPKL